MREPWDRARHAVLFETLLLMFSIMLGLVFFNADFGHIGGLAIILTVIAMCVNYVFNWVFDQWMYKKWGHSLKSPKLRFCHALGFEFVLLLATVPVMAWSLEIGLYHALVADLGFVGFVLIYGYGFNVWYDRYFPFPLERV